MANLDLHTRQMESPHQQDNFDRVRFAIENNLFMGFTGRIITIVLLKAETNLVYPHGLKVQPTDVFTTFASNGAIITWNYDKFSKENINLTSDKASVIRAIVGSFKDFVG